MRYIWMILIVLLAHWAPPVSAQHGNTKLADDRQIVDATGAWLYNDLDAALAEAKRTDKPMLIAFRCIP